MTTDFISFSLVLQFTLCIFFDLYYRSKYNKHLFLQALARCDCSSRMKRQKKAASQNGDIPNKTMIFRNKYVDQIGYDSILRWSAYILWIVHICLCISLPIPLARDAHCWYIWNCCVCIAKPPFYIFSLCSTC